MNIAFIFAPENVGRPFDFTRLWDDPRGMTGTDSACLIFARELVKRGHSVSLYIDNPNAAEFDGVQLKDLSANREHHDVALSFIYSRFFRGMSPNVLRVNFQTCNSFDYEAPNFEDDVDLFLSPSEHHCAYMQKWTLNHHSKWEVQRLGCYVDDYPMPDQNMVSDVFKTRGRVIHTSSPDRGLHLLLEQWPAIVDAVPHAHLKIFYHGLDGYIERAGKVGLDAKVTIDQIEHGCRARFIGGALKRLKNVEVVGSTSRNQMKRELSEAQVLAYPCETISYSEGFSVSTLEGCASWALPIIAGCDALGDVYRGVLPMVEHPARKHAAAWRKLVIKALTDESWRANRAAVARNFALQHHYPNLAEELELKFERAIERKRTAPPVWTSQTGSKNSTAQWTPSIQSQEKIPIDFVLTPYAGGDDPIDPIAFSKESRGGGSRTGFMYLVRAMAERSDYQVRAFAKFTRSEDVLGVSHRLFEEFNRGDPSRKVLFAYYDTGALRDVNTGCLRIASHHTYVPPDIWFSSHCDVSTAPTEHAVDHLRRGFDPHGKWYVLPNGVADPFIEWKPVAGRVLYHGSPDRGLFELLGMWPAIRAAVPEATLHVTGDVVGTHYGDTMLFPSFARNTIGKRVMALREGLRVARAAGGVELLGKVSRDLMRFELGQASCFAYPCSVAMPCETFSVCIMECMRAGVPVVLCPADALSFYDDIAMMEPGPIEEHRAEFVEAVVHVLKSYPRQLSCHHMGRRFAIRYTHQRMATVLDQIIRENLR